MNSNSQLSGRRGYGIALTMMVCVLWGFFPIAAKAVLMETDPYTLNFYRFVLPLIIMWVFLWRRRQLPSLWRGQQKPLRGRVLLAAVLLIGNYILFAYGLGRITPGASQVLIQVGTMVLLLSGVFLFGEKFLPRQWLGCAVFVTGLLIFFLHRIVEMFDGFNSYAVGMGIMLLAALSWALYAVIQKPLLKDISSIQILVVVFAIGVIMFLPLAELSAISRLSTFALAGLGFCTFSTLIGTAAFAEALAHWEASRISASLTSIPLFTLLFMQLLSLHPEFHIPPEPITTATVLGALLVVGGASLVALGGGPRETR